MTGMESILPAVILTMLTTLSTLLGGMFAFRHKDQLSYVLAFTAGVLVSVVAFDVFPEIIHLEEKISLPPKMSMLSFIAGFLLFHLIEKSILLHAQASERRQLRSHKSIGIISALALSGHSFLDGLGIGLGFKVSTSLGIAVAIAVVSHDFSDGLNTVSFMLANDNDAKISLVLLMLDAFAPVLGVLSILLLHISDTLLLVYLGFFAGFLMYLGAAEILPRVYEKEYSYIHMFLTVLGVALIYSINVLILS